MITYSQKRLNLWAKKNNNKKTPSNRNSYTLYLPTRFSEKRLNV